MHQVGHLSGIRIRTRGGTVKDWPRIIICAVFLRRMFLCVFFLGMTTWFVLEFSVGLISGERSFVENCLPMGLRNFSQCVCGCIISASGFGVWDSGFRVQGSWFRVQDRGFMLQLMGLIAHNFGCYAWFSTGFEVQGSFCVVFLLGPTIGLLTPRRR